MLFHTLTFAIFFSIVVTLLALARGNTQKKIVLLLSSYVFYMWWNPTFVALIVVSTLIDYAVGLALDRTAATSHRKWLVAVSVCAQLGFLGYFKYAGFLADNLFLVSRWLGFQGPAPALDITLPVGISFYTFATLSYSIDIYRRELRATRSLLDFSLFIIFFPHLVAGPIVRAAQLLPQLQREAWLRCDQQTVFLFLRGLAKKVLVADNVAPLANAVFAAPAQWPSLVVWIATVCFSIQIYCDFSGYSDMAIAVARVLGYDLPVNFRHPYLATNPSDFWRRWHITLSSWLRDYVYIPLGGGRGASWRISRNLLLTMLLGGLWHGASWNFVLWGAWHGLLLIGHRAYAAVRGAMTWLDVVPSKIRRFLSLAAMQLCVLISWILFRVTDSGKLADALRKVAVFDRNLSITSLGLGTLGMVSTLAIVAVFGALHLWSYRHGSSDVWLGQARSPFAAAACLVAGLLLFVFWPSTEAAFIYFQF